MPSWQNAWPEALAAGARREPAVEELIGTLAGRQALARQMVRESERRGRPIKYASAMRRLQRYGAPEGRQRRRPSSATISEMRRLRRRDILLPAAQLANERGADIRIARPFLIVSPGARRGDRRARPRPEIAVSLSPGALDEFIRAIEGGDFEMAGDQLTATILESWEDGILGDAAVEITDVSAMDFFVR